VNAAPPDPAIEALKREVALRLGLMVMEYSRLETELGLVLYWADEGRRSEEMAAILRRADFNARLKLLRSHLRGRERAHAGYAEWVRDADEARRLRNRLMHGRWSIPGPSEGTVTNVRGDPFAREHEETTLTLADLDGQLADLKALRRRLAALRESSPL